MPASPEPPRARAPTAKRVFVILREWLRQTPPDVRVGVATAVILIFQLAILTFQLCLLHQADETTRISNRAYVAVSLDIAQGTSQVSLIPVFENVGNTETIDLKWTGLFDPLFRSGSDVPKIDLTNPTWNRLVLGPKSRFPIQGVAPVLSSDDMAAVIRGAANPLFAGVMTYRTAFNEFRVTKFCFFVWAYPPLTRSGLAYSQCSGESNCTDKSCPEYDSLRLR